MDSAPIGRGCLLASADSGGVISLDKESLANEPTRQAALTALGAWLMVEGVAASHEDRKQDYRITR